MSDNQELRALDDRALAESAQAVGELELNGSSDFTIAETAIRAYLTAAESRLSASSSKGDGWRVKPLEWRNESEIWEAESGFGALYSVEEIDPDLPDPFLMCPPGAASGSWHPSEDAAKAAAQADYEARIRSAILPPAPDGLSQSMEVRR